MTAVIERVMGTHRRRSHDSIDLTDDGQPERSRSTLKRARSGIQREVVNQEHEPSESSIPVIPVAETGRRRDLAIEPQPCLTRIPKVKVPVGPYAVRLQPPFEVDHAPPYPPIMPWQTELTEEQKSGLYRRPLVDLRHETFIEPSLRNLWKSTQRRAIGLQTGPKRRLTAEDPEWKEYIVLEGPVPMASGKKDRRILKYRIFDGNEILLYVNASKRLKRYSTLGMGTEINSPYKKRLTPYIPGTRIPPKESNPEAFELLRRRSSVVRPLPGTPSRFEPIIVEKLIDYPPVAKETRTGQRNTNVLQRNTNVLQRNTNVLQKNTNVLQRNTNALHNPPSLFHCPDCYTTGHETDRAFHIPCVDRKSLFPLRTKYPN